MRLLITGHRGLVGSACVRHFSKLGYEIYTDTTREIDLRNKERTLDWFESVFPDYIIHCAAKVGGVLANKTYPVEFYMDNVQIQNSVLHSACLVGAKKVISLATSCLFPNSAPVPVCEESLMSGDFEESVSAYATAKLGGFRLSQAFYHEYGCNFMTGCPANVFGIGDTYDLEKSHVVPALIMKFHKAINEGGAVNVWGDGSAVRELIFADDLACAIEVVLNDWNKPDLINMGTGISTSIRELVNELVRITGFEGEIIYDTSKPTGITRKTFNIDKIKSLGWKQKYPLSDALELTWDDYCQRTNTASYKS